MHWNGALREIPAPAQDAGETIPGSASPQIRGGGSRIGGNIDNFRLVAKNMRAKKRGKTPCPLIGNAIPARGGTEDVAFESHTAPGHGKACLLDTLDLGKPLGCKFDQFKTAAVGMGRFLLKCFNGRMDGRRVRR